MTAYADVSLFPRDAKPLTSYRKYWAQRFGTAPFLPMNRQEMAQLGWDSCDIILWGNGRQHGLHDQPVYR
jgi:hypothetical protein